MKDGRIVGRHTKKTVNARLRLDSVFFLPRVINFSASRWASLALGHVVVMDSCWKREVTRLRRRACRCDDFRLRWRYLVAPPAMVMVCDYLVGRRSVEG